jgi:hypothetical protein
MSYKSRIVGILVIAAFFMMGVRSLAGIPRTGSCEELKYADRLWWAGQFHETHGLYAEIANSTNSSTLDRSGALQRMALQAWLKYGEADSALLLLNRAVQLGEGKAISYAMMSRFVLEEGRADSALTIAGYAINESEKLSDSLQAVVAYARSIFELAKDTYLSGGLLDTMLLRKTVLRLETIGRQAPLETDVWEQMLGIALLLGDGSSVRQAWNQYLAPPRDDSLPGFSGDSMKGLSEALSNWNDSDLTDDSRRILIKALAASRMFKYVRLVSGNPALPNGTELTNDPEIAGILRYAELISEARTRINQIYRKRLTGDSTIAVDIQEFLGLAYNYWLSLDYPGERPEFTTDEIGAQLSSRWGAVFCSVDLSPENFDITWGHEIRTDIREIDQYGHQLEVKFVELDQMVSTGMMEWVSDGDISIGGWTPTPEAVYRIRPPWQGSGLRAWEALTLPGKREEIQNRILSLRIVDDSLANSDPYSNLPGADLRLRYASLHRLYDSLVSSGYTGGKLRRAFINEYQRLRYESSIVAHEGRHAIDMVFRSDEFESWDAAQVELSGKLSEVLFSPDPWYTVGNSSAIFYSGDTTSGHGEASRLLRKQLVDWMEIHADEIDSFDHSRPTLPQLDLLSNEQLLMALRELDSLAKAGK